MSTRRAFITACGKVIGGAAGLSVFGSALLPILDSCAPTSIPLGPSTTKIPVGSDGRIAVDVSDLTQSQPVKVVPDLIGPDGKPVMITRIAEGQYKALSMNCTHQGCTVESTVKNGDIPCLCHNSLFALDGSVVQGPATTPLAEYPSNYDAAGHSLHILVPQ